MKLSVFVEEEVPIGTIVNVIYKEQEIEMNAWDWTHSEHEWLDLTIKHKEKVDHYEYNLWIE